MPTRMNAIDAAVLSIMGTAWLIAPAYLEEVQKPFASVVSVVLLEMPVVLASAFVWCFVVRGRVRSGVASVGEAPMGRLLFFGFLAYFWSLVDDGPVDFDSVLTWPEVTSGLQHTLLEVLLHALTLAFLFLAVREASRGTVLTGGRRAQVAILVLVAFWASYAQNTPLAWVQALTASDWYALDAAEHLASVAFFSLAIRECLSAKGANDRA